MGRTYSVDVHAISEDEKNTEYYEINGSVIEHLRENHSDEEINSMTPNEMFAEELEYEGIIGYEHYIKGLIADIYEINLDEVAELKTKDRTQFALNQTRRGKGR